MNEILKAEEVAKLLCCDDNTIEEKARQGKLPGLKFGRGWVFPRDALIETINQMAKQEAETRRTGKPTQPAAIATTPNNRRTGKQPPKLPSLAA